MRRKGGDKGEQKNFGGWGVTLGGGKVAIINVHVLYLLIVVHV